MKRGHRLGIVYVRALVACVVLCLVVSFGMHSVQIEHAHPGEVGPHAAHAEEISIAAADAYMHGTDKKFLLLMLGALALVAVSAIFLQPRAWVRHLRALNASATGVLYRRQRVARSEHDYLTRLFRCGILHPQLH